MLEREKIEEELEKKRLELEDCLECSHEDLWVEVKELRECGCQNERTIFGLLTHME